MKKIICRIKRLRGPHLIQFGQNNDPDPAIEFIRGLGYLVYENPGQADVGEFIVSDSTLTYGDCQRYHKRLGIDLKWWHSTTFSEIPGEELQDA